MTAPVKKLPDPLDIDDEQAVNLLRRLPAAAPPDLALRYVQVLYDVRRRAVWVPAAEALARMASQDARSLSWLEVRWSAVLPDGLPSSWPRLLRDLGPQGSKDTHGPRHAVVAACALAAEAPDLAVRLKGFELKRLLDLGLPPDNADASAVLLGWLALAKGSTSRPLVVQALPGLAGEVPFDLLGEQVLRDLADTLRDEPGAAPAVVAIERRLTEPGWRSAAGRQILDSLWSWLLSASWFAARGDEASIAAMRANAGAAGQAFELVLGQRPGGEASPVEAAVWRLSRALDGDFVSTCEPQRRAVLFAELLLLLQREEVRDLPWPALVGRACPTLRPSAAEGAVAEVARGDLAALTRVEASASSLLLRDVPLTRAGLLKLAEVDDGGVMRHVAVEAERQLRAEASPAGRVRLLWQLMQRTRRPLLFGELLSLIRRGPEKPDRNDELLAVVRAIATLDRIEANGGASAELAGAYESLVVAAEGLVSTQRGAELRLFRPAASIDQLLGGETNGKLDAPERRARWLEALRRLIRGGDGMGGILEWMDWLGQPVPELGAAQDALKEAIERVARSAPATSMAQCDELSAALKAFRSASRTLAWPEATILRAADETVRHWSTRSRGIARRSEVAAERAKRIIERGAEDEAVAMAESEEASVLPAAEARALGRFLLEHLRFAAAARLRARHPDRASIPGPLSRGVAFLGAVGAGVLVLIQSGDVTAHLANHSGVDAASTWKYLAVLSLASLASLAVFMADVGGRMRARDGSLAARALRLLWKILPVAALGTVVAVALSWGLLYATEGSSVSPPPGEGVPRLFWRQVWLWSSLALFIAIVATRIVQRRES